MTALRAVLAITLTATTANPSRAQHTARKVFDCHARGLGATITRRGEELTLAVTQHAGPDRIVKAEPASPYARILRQRMAGQLTQVRFVSGERSYVAYSMPASRMSGSADVSGITVLDGRHVVADHPCRRFAPMGELPAWLTDDDEDWNAMAMDIP